MRAFAVSAFALAAASAPLASAAAPDSNNPATDKGKNAEATVTVTKVVETAVYWGSVAPTGLGKAISNATATLSTAAIPSADAGCIWVPDASPSNSSANTTTPAAPLVTSTLVGPDETVFLSGGVKETLQGQTITVTYSDGTIQATDAASTVATEGATSTDAADSTASALPTSGFRKTRTRVVRKLVHRDSGFEKPYPYPKEVRNEEAVRRAGVAAPSPSPLARHRAMRHEEAAVPTPSPLASVMRRDTTTTTFAEPTTTSTPSSVPTNTVSVPGGHWECAVAITSAASNATATTLPSVSSDGSPAADATSTTGSPPSAVSATAAASSTGAASNIQAVGGLSLAAAVAALFAL